MDSYKHIVWQMALVKISTSQDNTVRNIGKEFVSRDVGLNSAGREIRVSCLTTYKICVYIKKKGEMERWGRTKLI